MGYKFEEHEVTLERLESERTSDQGASRRVTLERLLGDSRPFAQRSSLRSARWSKQATKEHAVTLERLFL